MSIWEQLESWYGFTCPACQRTLLVNLGTYSVINDMKNQKFGVQCPFCQHVFAFALVLESYKGPLPENTSVVGLTAVGAPVVTSHPVPPSGTGALAHSSQRDQANNQRSNVMNSNNAAYKAARNNRSNQMNPNSPAYRSSRRRG
ncbi:MAG: hypothetical protein HYX82_04075 [Chloroflexi bacterium]|nr:hypothetical protein [Chloroflexota bacterium]